MAGNNINANRVLTGATNTSLNFDQVTLDNKRTGVAPTFQYGVVEEVIYNPKSLTETDRNRIRGLVVNATAVDTMAANSVVATLVSDGISNAIPTKVLLAPFFQSHIMFPIVAGEQVTVVFDDMQKFGFMSGKWITRVSEGLPTEDPNFTHGDRRFSKKYLAPTRTSESVARSEGSYTPDFQNGGGQPNTFTLPQEDNLNPYETIYRNTLSGNLVHNYEVVPRWTKRPQEFVVQGMNNSLIMLGQDRVGYVTGSVPDIEQKAYAGSIDIVTGRGRFPLLPADQIIPQEQQSHKRTSPLILTNSRGLEEVDKVPSLNGRQEQLEEGDPDFVHDASRIYVSMKTLGDMNFRLQKTSQGAANNAMQPTGINYSNTSIYPVQPTSASVKIGTAYIVNKTDHLRLIARRSDPRDDSLDSSIISGSVLLLKEGNNRTPERNDAQTADSDHLAYMFISPEGRVQVDGMQIFLGGAALRSTSDNQQPSPDMPLSVPTGSNMSEINMSSVPNMFAGAEPYIKWSEFQKVVEGLHQQINDLQNAFSGLVQDLNRASGGTACTPWGPDVAWAPLAASAQQRDSKLEGDVNAHRIETNEAVYRSRSAKIFGQ